MMASENVYPVVELRSAAMDLARRLSSMQHFLPAAHQLLTCEHLSPEEIDRHARKIVTLIEIARSTLLRHNVRLFHFATCPPVFAHHKEAYFDLLRMLKGMRRHIASNLNDSNLNERIARLLLSLSTSMHIVLDAGDSNSATANCSSAEACRESLLSPRSPSPPPVMVNNPNIHRNARRQDTMPPPDVLLSRPLKRPRLSGDENAAAPEPRGESVSVLDSPPRGRRLRRSSSRASLHSRSCSASPYSLTQGFAYNEDGDNVQSSDSHRHCDSADDDEDEDDAETMPAYLPVQKPPRRFGILFTMAKAH